MGGGPRRRSQPRLGCRHLRRRRDGGKLQAAARWRLNYAEHWDGIRAHHLATGTPLPEDVVPVDRLPETDLILAWFDDLVLDRPLGFGVVGAIPWTAVAAWAQAHGLGDPDALAFLARGVRIVDALWREKTMPPTET